MKPVQLLPPNGHEPWERGRLLAQQARAAWNISTDRVDNPKLVEIFSADFLDAPVVYNKAPLGLAVRNGDPDRLRLLFRKRNRFARRFEAARFLAETLVAPAADRWLPATDSKTARQKLQRAFAAEFLCPIQELTEFLDNNLSEEAIENASEHFGVSERAVVSQLTPPSMVFGTVGF